MASTYDRLGTIAHQRGHLDDAEGWLRKSQAICMEIGYARGVGNACSHLGGVAHDRGQLDKAEEWHRRALAIAEESGDGADIARSFHMLGMLAHERGELDVAGDWYRKALGLEKETGDVSQLPKTLVLLGVLAAQGNDARQALDWMIRSVALFDEYPHPFSGAGPEHLAELTRVLGLPVLEEAWRRLTGNDLPQAVRDHVATAVPTTWNGAALMADDPVEEIARATAQRLAPEFGSRLETEVEAALLARDSTRGAEQYDLVAIGALLVAIAQFAWDVYTSHRDKPREVAEHVLRTEIRREFEITEGGTKITDVIIKEITGGEH
jgi:tetratricopeptide (TPR) repeat protein